MELDCRVLAPSNVDIASTSVGMLIDSLAIQPFDFLFLLNQTIANDRTVWMMRRDGTLKRILDSVDPTVLVVVKEGAAASNTYRWDPSPGEWVLQGTSTTGLNGSKWYEGSGAPSSGTGVDGDFYLNVTNDDIYTKVSGSWGSPVGNIKGSKGDKGDTGDPGTAGAAWFEGSGAPSGGTGSNGDLYLNTSNGDVYQKIGSSWGSPVGNIKGTPGNNGADGSLLHATTQTARDELSAGLFNGVECVTTEYSLLWVRPSTGASNWYLRAPQPFIVGAICTECTDVTATFTGTADGQTLLNGVAYLVPNDPTSPGLYIYTTSTQKFDKPICTTVNSLIQSGFLVFSSTGTLYGGEYWLFNGIDWVPLRASFSTHDTTRTIVQDANGYRTFEYEKLVDFQLANSASQNVVSITADEYGGSGTLVPGHLSDMTIEVTLLMMSFDHSGGGGTLSQTGVVNQGTWIAAWNKVSPLPSGPTGSWNHSSMSEISGLHLGNDWTTDMGISLDLDHSGAEDGTMTLKINHNTGTWATGQNWSTAKFRIRIFGGGRYA